MDTIEKTCESPEMYCRQNQDLLDKEVTFKDSILVTINYEVPGTDHITENKQDIQGQFKFPISSHVMDLNAGKLLETSGKVSENIKSVLKLLMQDMMEVGLWSKENSKATHKLSALNILSLFAYAPDSIALDLKALYVNGLGAIFYYIIDDCLDKAKENSDELIVDEKTMSLFIDSFASTTAGESVSIDFRTLIQCKEMGELLNGLIRLWKKVCNILIRDCSLFSNVIQRRHTLIEWIKYLWATFWFQKVSLEDISDETYFTLRRGLVAFTEVIEFWMLTKGYCLDDTIRSDPMLIRILTAATTIAGLINDLMSFSKELDKVEYDSYILRKYRQGLPIEKAFQRTHEIIARECSDYITLSKKFREAHADNIMAQTYMDISDFQVGNIIPYHAIGHRYSTKCYVNGKLLSPESMSVSNI